MTKNPPSNFANLKQTLSNKPKDTTKYNKCNLVSKWRRNVTVSKYVKPIVIICNKYFNAIISFQSIQRENANSNVNILHEKTAVKVNF